VRPPFDQECSENPWRMRLVRNRPFSWSDGKPSLVRLGHIDHAYQASASFLRHTDIRNRILWSPMSKGMASVPQGDPSPEHPQGLSTFSRTSGVPA